jgi:hypothetical protein
MLPPAHVNLEDLSKQTQSYILNLQTSSRVADNSSDDDMAGPLPEGLEPERRVISLVQDSKRESWMTQLPEGRRAPTTTVFANAFSQRGVRDQGDTSEWTETPQERAAKMARPNRAVSSAACRPVDAVPDLVAQYNAVTRPKTLMEIHQEQVKKGVIRDDEETEKRRDLEKTTGIRFFDRDKDLQVHAFISAYVFHFCAFLTLNVDAESRPPFGSQQFASEGSRNGGELHHGAQVERKSPFGIPSS